MSLLDYVKDNWKDSYRPFTRYPEIYGENFEQGMGLLTEGDQGWSSLYKKPLGLLNISGIPALYEAFRDEPIRDNLINAGMDRNKAGYATMAIGTAMDVLAPWAVIKKGMTPWVSEYTAKQINPTQFDPSKRRLLKGAGAATALASTGSLLDLVPTGTTAKVAKQAAKSTPFSSLFNKMNASLKDIIPMKKEDLGIYNVTFDKFRQKYDQLTLDLEGLRDTHMDVETGNLPNNPSFRGEHYYGSPEHQRNIDYQTEKWRHYDEVFEEFPFGNDPPSWKEISRINDVDIYQSPGILFPERHGVWHPKKRDKVEQAASGEIDPRSVPVSDGSLPSHGIEKMFERLARAKEDYRIDPEGFINGANEKIKQLKEWNAYSKKQLQDANPSDYNFGHDRYMYEDSIKTTTKRISDLEQFIKDLQSNKPD